MNNVAASVRARLLNVAKAQGSDFNQVPAQDAVEHRAGLTTAEFAAADAEVDAPFRGRVGRGR